MCCLQVAPAPTATIAPSTSSDATTQATTAPVALTAPLQPPSGAAAPAVPSSPPARVPISVHKSTTLIPGWSRALSSQQLLVECQNIARPAGAPPAPAVAGGAGLPPREDLGVLDMEVMKFVAYCGGVCVKFRMDEVLPPTAAHAPSGAPPPLVWGLASTRACNALLQQAASPPVSGSGRLLPPPLILPSDNGTGGGGNSIGKGGSGGRGHAAVRAAAGGALYPANPGAAIPVDSHSRKALYVTCTACVPAGEVLLGLGWWVRCDGVARGAACVCCDADRYPGCLVRSQPWETPCAPAGVGSELSERMRGDQVGGHARFRACCAACLAMMSASAVCTLAM